MMSDLENSIKVENEVILHTTPDILHTTPDINISKLGKGMSYRNVVEGGTVVGSTFGKESSESGELIVGGGSPFHQWDHGYGRSPVSYSAYRQGCTPNSRTSTFNSARTQAVKRRLNLEASPEEEAGFKTPKSRRKSNPLIKSPSPRGVIKTPTRYDTSLGLLTKKFVTLLQSSSRGIVDLNYASKHLGVQKRRIYDITNVLEGIGILEKKSKNNIQWRGGTVSDSQTTVQRDLENLEKEEKHLDDLIRKAESDVNCLSLDDKCAYICYQDLRNIKKFSKRTVMVIKAPPNTRLTIPEALSADRNEMILKSEVGEIEVFLCPETKTLKEDPQFNSGIPLSSSFSGDEDSDSGEKKEFLWPSVKETMLSVGGGTGSSKVNDDLSSYPLNDPTTSEGDCSSLCDDLPYFLSVEPPIGETDYLFSLEHNEGLADLFDLENFE